MKHREPKMKKIVNIYLFFCLLAIGLMISSHPIKADGVCSIDGNKNPIVLGNQNDAETYCPGTCTNAKAAWDGSWTNDSRFNTCVKSTTCGCTPLSCSDQCNLAYEDCKNPKDPGKICGGSFCANVKNKAECPHCCEKEWINCKYNCKQNSTKKGKK